MKQLLAGAILILAAACGSSELRPETAPGHAPAANPGSLTFSSVPPSQMEPGPLPKLPPAARST